MSCRCNHNSNDSDHSACNNSNSSSACALRDILNDVDSLNTQDLCTLKEVVDRLLACRS